jgi:hypothetical protein
VAASADAEHCTAGAKHWAITGGEVRIGILFRGDDAMRTTVADAARRWSDALPSIEIGIVGEAPIETCD